jgi:hypothetical protein
LAFSSNALNWFADNGSFTGKCWFRVGCCGPRSQKCVLDTIPLFLCSLILKKLRDSLLRGPNAYQWRVHPGHFQYALRHGNPKLYQIVSCSWCQSIFCKPTKLKIVCKTDFRLV